MVKHPREHYEKMIKEFPYKKHFGKKVPLWLCGDALKDMDIQEKLYKYLLQNYKKFGTPAQGPFGILFLDSTYKKVPAFLDDLFDEDKKEIYSAVEYLTLNSVGSLI